MRILILIISTSFFLTGNIISAQKNKKNKKELSVKNNTVALTNELDSVSYSLGMNMAMSFKKEFSEINYEQFINGLNDNFNKTEESAINEADVQTIIQNYFMKKQQIKQDQEKEQLAPKIIEGEEFLANNGKRKNVITTESGLQYEVLVEGDGSKPSLTDEVETHYHGTLIDGTVFDSSVDRGESISFPVNGVIPGWTEALLLMPVGSKWKLYIPYQLAYGERGAGQMIGPYSTLIFEVELISIK